MKIKVTQEHIDEGKPGWPRSCPIALACESAGLDLVLVGQTEGSQHAYAIYGVSAKRIELPWVCSLFMVNFDHHRTVSPFEFEMEVGK